MRMGFLVCGRWMLGEIGKRSNGKIARRARPCAPAAPAPHNFPKPAPLERSGRARSRPMPQTQSKFFDDLSRLMTDAAGVADGARREAQTFARAQLERMMAGMNVVAREEFEAVKEMAARAREENEKLAARVAALEARLGEPGP
jgi:BMFP domain-containing protein YqiC